MIQITAPLVHNGKEFMPEGTTLTISDTGFITEILDTPSQETQHFEGVLVPGFVNVHTHVELSHLKGCVPERKGLVTFLQDVMKHRNNYSDAEKANKRADAFDTMLQNGIVGIGDICNTTDTLDFRALDKMHIHSFVESLGISEQHSAAAFGKSLQVYNQYLQQTFDRATTYPVRQSITPHAPYSVSPSLMRMINDYQSSSIISIHNQETKAEDQLFYDRTGSFQELYSFLGIDINNFNATGKSSLQSVLSYFLNTHSFVLVHNTYTSLADVQFATTHFRNTHWCLCPNANMYIEDTLPDISMLSKAGVHLCIGTDSLASNHQLDIMSELCVIKQHYPNIGWEQLLHWGTYNGAKALQFDTLLGSFAVGKQPGVLLLSSLSDEYTIKRLA